MLLSRSKGLYPSFLTEGILAESVRAYRPAGRAGCYVTQQQQVLMTNQKPYYGPMVPRVAALISRQASPSSLRDTCIARAPQLQ